MASNANFSTATDLNRAYIDAALKHWTGQARRGTQQRSAVRVLEWLWKQGISRVDEVENWRVEQYASERLKAGIRPTTVNAEISALALIVGRPLPHLPVDYKRNRHLTADEERRMLEYFESHSTQMHRICIVALDCGLRISEVLNMCPAHFDETKRLLVIPKGKTHSSGTTLPLTDRAWIAIMAQLPRGFHSHERLWGFTTESDIYVRWSRMRRALGLEKDRDFTFHALRHTTANRLLERGARLDIVQQFMRHKRITTTMRYITDSGEKLRTAADLLMQGS